jgi:AcrR family transcriptional regulator
MPTPTWERLPEARRAAVIAAAEREFAANGFSRGSLNVIAREAGVAKGSLFQYFLDKVDLFEYVVELAAQRVGTAIGRRSNELAWSDGFFPALTALLEEWMEYFRTHPDDRSLVANDLDRIGFELLRPLVIDAQANGFVRPDADVDAFLFLLMALLPHLADTRLRDVALHRLVAVLEDAFGTPSSSVNRSDRRLSRLAARWPRLNKQ